MIVDGQDAEAVRETMRQAVERARAGQGPTLVEAKTYRYKGHSRTDPAPYRPDGELDRWLKRDPITILAERMQADGQLTDAELATLRAEALAAVQDATTWALEQPYPPLAAAFEDIWV